MVRTSLALVGPEDARGEPEDARGGGDAEVPPGPRRCCDASENPWEGCVHLGGAELAGGRCGAVCDIPPEHFVIGHDAHGCLAWAVPGDDFVREPEGFVPAPDNCVREGEQCFGLCFAARAAPFDAERGCFDHERSSIVACELNMGGLGSPNCARVVETGELFEFGSVVTLLNEPGRTWDWCDWGTSPGWCDE
jgi:hypothetical protein